jgi:hypothetical protein
VTEDTWVGINSRNENGKFKKATDGKDVTSIFPWHQGEPPPCVKRLTEGSYDNWYCPRKIQISCENIDTATENSKRIS